MLLIIEVIKRTTLSSCPKERRRKKQHLHLCLDRAYISKSVKQEIINRGYVPHMPYKRKRGQAKEKYTYKSNILLLKIKEGLYEKEQIHDGITDSESCLSDMKRKQRVISWISAYIM